LESDVCTSLKKFPESPTFIKEFMVKMSPKWDTTVFNPEMVLQVIQKLMNTLIILLIEQGESVSTKAIE